MREEKGGARVSSESLPVEIQVEDLINVSAGTLKRAHLPDHGQDSRERAVGGLEGHMEDGACVDYLVDCLEGVLTCEVLLVTPFLFL